MRTSPLALVVGLGALLALAAPLVAAQPEPDIAKHEAGALKSGWVYAEPQTRAMQDDDFSNPGFLWVDKGKALWAKADGASGKSCASCHNAAEASMKGVAAKYPLFDAAQGKLVDIEQRINLMRTEKMGAKAYDWESDEMLSMTAYVKLQARGARVNVATDGPAHAFWLKGQQFYQTRRGQLDLSCEQCHVQNLERKLRTETLTQGQSNGFPTYRLSWQTLGSIQRRFRECNSQIRAEPLAYGSDEYVNLELFVASRGQGLPVESPAVRK